MDTSAPAPAPLRTINIPAIGAAWPEQGGIFAGIGHAIDGSEYLLIVGPEAPEHMQWQAAVDWAKSWCAPARISDSRDDFSDFTLPTRREQSLMFANVPDLFKRDWYWSSEARASYESYAWMQHFGYGGQSGYLKDDLSRARAVRRLPI